MTGRSNQSRGIDAAAAHTIAGGQLTICAAVDPGRAGGIGVHAANPATWLEALEPLRQGLRQPWATFHMGTGSGIRLRHDHGSRFMSDDFQMQIRFPGMEPFPVFVPQREGHGCVARFFRTLAEQLLGGLSFHDLDELHAALRKFGDRHRCGRLIESLGFQSPQQARDRLLSSGLLDDVHAAGGDGDRSEQEPEPRVGRRRREERAVQ